MRRRTQPLAEARTKTSTVSRTLFGKSATTNGDPGIEKSTSIGFLTTFDAAPPARFSRRGVKLTHSERISYA